ncbi:hypothetical protein P3T35_003227 [Kitasatospora sp. GP30]|uniref:hypothetical protein n=1 Tax=Kitasatospora sp. GP30 TaxID=3035084 RepID=UPI000C708AC0|nr:hypothetical protein [Kitasatospora sp. GP30]MDH6141210.1 hypothetical protein [Kitasatospora sp. GP30]
MPQARRGERFHYSGVTEGKTVDEFPIEWPEPGAVAMAIATARSSDERLSITPMTRTRSRIRTHDSILDTWGFEDGPTRRRTVLGTDITHLKVEGLGGRAEWSVQLVGPADLEELVDEREGTGDVVLAVRPEAPVEVVVHANSDGWGLRFVCGCWAGDECACERPKGLEWFPDSIYETGEAMATLVIPRPGLLVCDLQQPTDPWRLRLRPLGSED